MLKIAMLIFISFLGFLLFVSLWGFYFAVRPMKIVSAVTPKDFGVTYETVSFRTKDNVLIRGWFIPNSSSNAKTIILLHGYPADKGDILSSRIFLHQSYNLLFLDFRYLGESGGSYSTVGKNEVFDLLAAIDYLNTRGIFEVGVWGLSMGGAVALMAAAKTTAIKAVVAESAYARLDWVISEYYHIPLLRYPLAELTRFWAWLFLGYRVNEISPANEVEGLKIPILLIASKQDNVISFRHALLLQQALHHDPHLKVVFVEDLKHGETVEDYQQLIKHFFDENLK